jgi:hypothetical protein
LNLSPCPTLSTKIGGKLMYNSILQTIGETPLIKNKQAESY